ncbi:MAG TPA: hypothetical protein VG754_05910 [Verrucomicrobiae bacterium]|nr:hypothetical protein [Verrucomicrobiae bacterium]
MSVESNPAALARGKIVEVPGSEFGVPGWENASSRPAGTAFSNPEGVVSKNCYDRVGLTDYLYRSYGA